MKWLLHLSIALLSIGSAYSYNTSEETVKKYIPAYIQIPQLQKTIKNKDSKDSKKHPSKKDVIEQFSKDSFARDQQLNTCNTIISSLLNKSILSPCKLSKGFEEKSELVGSSLEQSLIHKLNRTATCAGELCFIKLLTSPTNDTTELIQRQAIVKALVENQSLLTMLQNHLKELKHVEITLLHSFLSEQNNSGDLEKNTYPFGGKIKFVNQNSWGLELLSSINNTLQTINVFVIPLTSTGMNALAHKKFNASMTGKKISFFEACKRGIKSYLLSWNPGKVTFKEKSFTQLADSGLINPKLIEPKSFGDHLHLLDHKDHPLNPFHDSPITATSIKKAYLITSSIIIGFTGYTLYKYIQQVHLRNFIIAHMQQQLVDIAQYARTAQKIAHLIQMDPILKKSFGDMAERMVHGSHKFELLLQLLDTRTFNHVSFFSLGGRILAARKLLEEVHQEFAQMITFVGLTDAYASCAQLYLDHQEPGKAAFCFAEYTCDTNNPYIIAKEFWNPFIDPSIVVPNSIELKASNGISPQTMLLTGPNTGGKSTIIKALLINVLLAQTIGIAPSAHCALTPFATISCMLNITDDISNNTSMFQAEINAAKQLQNLIKSASDNNKFSFTIMDELFHGTNPVEGAQAATLFTKNIGGSPNSLCCVATHFQEVTKLESENATFKNYHVKAHRDPQTGAWIKPYTLFEGASDQTNALELLKDQGIF